MARLEPWRLVLGMVNSPFINSRGSTPKATASLRTLRGHALRRPFSNAARVSVKMPASSCPHPYTRRTCRGFLPYFGDIFVTESGRKGLRVARRDRLLLRGGAAPSVVSDHRRHAVGDHHRLQALGNLRQKKDAKVTFSSSEPKTLPSSAGSTPRLSAPVCRRQGTPVWGRRLPHLRGARHRCRGQR